MTAVALALLAARLYATPPAEPAFIDKPYPVEGLVARDMPYDGGGVALIKWSAMPYDGAGVKYKVYASTTVAGPWKEAMAFPSNKHYASDIKLPFWAWNAAKDRHAAQVDLLDVFPLAQSAKRDKTAADDEKMMQDSKEKTERENYLEKMAKTTYYFKVAAVAETKKTDATTVAAYPEALSEVVSTVPAMNYFNLPRLNNLIYSLVLVCIFLWFISHAKKRELFIRRIPGLDAVDDAIGRATEMGRPIVYQTGLYDMTTVSTIASTMILGEIAKKVAQYDATLKVPHRDPTVLPVCQEIVKQAYMEAGRIDSYREDINYFITTDQFAFTAAIDGMYEREKPAAVFYMGSFFAEALLMTEVGSNNGIIQIAGTDTDSQLPFFFTTCDYTLIGEELYAAGAYLSKDPVLLGTLRGQDIGKIVVVAGIILAVTAVTIGTICGWDVFNRVVMDPFNSF